MFALAMAALGAGVAPMLRSGRWRVFLFLFPVTSSHGMLDAFTNGGMGIAFLWPFSDARYFASFRPIQVASISVFRRWWGWREHADPAAD